MSSNFEHDHEENEDYGKQFRPDREIYVVKKDGSKELFNVQKPVCGRQGKRTGSG